MHIAEQNKIHETVEIIKVLTLIIQTEVDTAMDSSEKNRATQIKAIVVQKGEDKCEGDVQLIEIEVGQDSSRQDTTF